MCLMQYANNKGADQTARISAFVVHCLDSISLDSIAKISRLASFYGCAGRFVSGLVRNSRRHVLSCRGSNDLLEARKTKQELVFIKHYAPNSLPLTVNSHHVLFAVFMFYYFFSRGKGP